MQSCFIAIGRCFRVMVPEPRPAKPWVLGSSRASLFYWWFVAYAELAKDNEG